MKEATARIKINKLLEAAGWRFFAEGNTPANIHLEPGVTIKTADLDGLGDNFEKISKGFIDFLLLDAKGFPFIVLEAKAEDKNPLVGKEQARKYAKSQNCRFVILSNGNLHYFWERYREGATNAGLKWPLVPIGELCVVERGASPRPIHDFMTDAPDGVNWIKIGNAEVGGKYITSTKERVTPEGAAKSRRVKPGDFVLSNSMSFGRPYVMATDGCIHDGWLLLRDQSDRLDQDFLYNILGSKLVFAQFERAATGGVVNNLNSEIVRGVRIPLPPLEMQKEIVAEIEGYQKVINGARAVLDHYRPHIPIHPDWPMVELGEVCEAILTGPFGTSLHQSDYVADGIPVINPQNIVDGAISKDGVKMVSSETRGRLQEFTVRENDIVIGRRGEMGRCAVATSEMNGWLCGTGCFVIRLKAQCEVRFAFLQIASPKVKAYLEEQAVGVTMKNLNQGILSAIQIPLPPLATQQAIVAEIEGEQALVAANRELIARFENKIQATLARVWGEEAPAASVA